MRRPWKLPHRQIYLSLLFNIVRIKYFPSYTDYIQRTKNLPTELDREGNTILHVAAILESSTALQNVPGAALQMQRELQWFKVIPLTFSCFRLLSAHIPRVCLALALASDF